MSLDKTGTLRYNIATNGGSCQRAVVPRIDFMSRRKPLFTACAVVLFLHVSEDTKDDHGDQLKQKQCFGQRHHDHLPPNRGRNNLFSPFADLIIACRQYYVNQPSIGAVFVLFREISFICKRKGRHKSALFLWIGLRFTAPSYSPRPAW